MRGLPWEFCHLLILSDRVLSTHGPLSLFLSYLWGELSGLDIPSIVSQLEITMTPTPWTEEDGTDAYEN